MTAFDPRLTPARPDLAAAELAGKVEAARFVEGRPMQVFEGVVDLRRQPSPESGIDSQALYGETLRVFEEEEGYAWVQLDGDGYVGYLAANALRPVGPPATHRVAALRTFLYPLPNMKLPVLETLSLGSSVAVERIEGDFAKTAQGWLWAAHLRPIAAPAEDFVAVAELFLNTPYLWGGKSSIGIDCSGLVQLSLGMAGLKALRDSDMQKDLGEPVAVADDLSGLRRGDLVQWKGHCGIMLDAQTLLHANGHHMMVAKEPLREACARILKNSYGPITGIRRLPA